MCVCVCVRTSQDSSTCGHLVEGDGLGDPASQSHAHPLKQLFLGEQVLVPGQDLGKAERSVGAGGNRHLDH